MSFNMLVDDRPKSKIRAGTVMLSHKGGYGIAPRASIGESTIQAGATPSETIASEVAGDCVGKLK